jgi:hypothetical protein
MNSSHSHPRRRRTMEFGPEALETRELMTGGANTFAIIPGTVDKVNGTSSITFTIDPQHFTLRRHAVTMGVDVVANSSSTIKPLISSVESPHGDIVPQTFHSIYDPHLSHLAVASGKGTSAVLSPLKLYPHQPTRPISYVVHTDALGKTSGGYLLGFYLPGDANGDGTVNKTDLKIVKSEMGARAGQANYNFNADANRDGRIGKIDEAFAQENQGVTTNLSPVVSANYDSSHDVGGLSQRVSSIPQAHFTGTASPGAMITLSEVHKLVPDTSTTADSTGNYSIVVPLGNGVNTFNMTVRDSFGQVITGQIAPVSYINPAQTAAGAGLKS